MKLSTNALLLAASVALVAWSSSLIAHIASAIILALFWQQCGWLSHDFLHHQVFHNRVWGDAMGYFIGNVAQGFSVAWWKDKHNTHHAVPNIVASQDHLHNGRVYDLFVVYLLSLSVVSTIDLCCHASCHFRVVALWTCRRPRH